ncbi:hypothetical protein OE749_18475 [Aestuariibacter sp. AA17]|uniref:Uncharacterized protein n=1 Tax=Fluctibacter corallii TaxID=2984329 RepID=A0ABT3AEM4_9ALTE|nr:hypothetical protein [Aestuariibacter sp. AA17]MCV2886681.1 hypothetical protein [Aestuariibacter sp. AA17]
MSSLATASLPDKLEYSPLQAELGGIYSDNLNPTLKNDVSGYGASLAVNGMLHHRFEGAEIALDYDASSEYLKGSSSEAEFDDSFLDYSLGIYSHLYLQPAWQLHLGIATRQDEQRFGEGISRFQKNQMSPFTLIQQDISSQLIYGVSPDYRSISVSLGYKTDRYRENAIYPQQFESDESSAAATLRFAISDATQLLAEVEAQSFDYAAISREDFNVYSALGGVYWQLSGKSALSLMLGGYQNHADNGGDTSGLRWKVGFEYSPYEDSELIFHSGRVNKTSEDLFASRSIEDSYSIAWTRAFNSRWQLATNGTYKRVKFQSDNITNAPSSEVKEWALNVLIGFQLSSFQSLALEMMHKDVKGDGTVVEYDQNEVNILWKYQL